MNVIDPKSERGQELIRETATMTPTTQGDPPPQKKRGFWKALGNAAAEVLGNLIYQGPK